MRKCLSKVTGIIMLTVLMLTCCIQGKMQTVQAATQTSYVPITCYTIPTGRVNTYSYNNGNYSYTGYISGSSDRCVIKQVRSDGYCKVTYPTSRGSRTAYAQSNKFFSNVDFSTTTTQLGVRKTVYRRSNLSQSLGTVYADDQVQIVGISGNATQIIYPAGNSYKMGWVSGKYSASSDQNADLANGYYQIKSSIDSNYVLDVYGGWSDDGANIQLYQNHYSTNQGYELKKQSDGYYTITAIHSGKALDVENNGNYDGVNVLQWTPHGGDNQKWKVIKTADGYYSFISKSNGLYLDVNGGIASNETNIQCWSGNGTKAQKFILESVNVGNTSDSNKSNDSSELASPVPAGSKFSRKSLDGSWYGYHDINVNVTSSTPVYAIADGTVTYKQAYKIYGGVKYLTSYGNYIEFTSEDKVYTAKYCHLSSFEGVNLIIPSYRTKIESGSAGRINLMTKNVKKGDVLGYIGTTGNSSGLHLHFEIRKNGARIDPTSVITGLN